MRWTNRRINAQEAWLEMEWERPNRTDFYLMRIAMEVARVLSSEPEKFNVNSYKLKFEKELAPLVKEAQRKKRIETMTPEEIKEEKERATKVHRARWFGMLQVTKKEMGVE